METKIASEIILMARQDQRAQAHAAHMANPVMNKPNEIKHSVRLAEIISVYGWPSPRLVGEKAAYDAFYLVLHSDHDPDFQRSCLEAMKKANQAEQSTELSNYINKLTVHLNL